MSAGGSEPLREAPGSDFVVEHGNTLLLMGDRDALKKIGALEP